jgi:hypothetical protein
MSDLAGFPVRTWLTVLLAGLASLLAVDAAAQLRS